MIDPTKPAVYWWTRCNQCPECNVHFQGFSKKCDCGARYASRRTCRKEKAHGFTPDRRDPQAIRYVGYVPRV